MRREELQERVALRRAESHLIMEKASAWARKRYGIDNLFGLVKRVLLPDAPSSWRDMSRYAPDTMGVLYRSIPSVTKEEVSAFELCGELNLKPIELSYQRDSFAVNNPEKVSRLAGLCEYRRSEGYPLNSFSGIGGQVASIHQRRREKVFGLNYPVVDLSNFYSECLRRSTVKPSRVYDISRRQWVMGISFTNGQCQKFRPAAEWILPIFLSLFLDGRAVWLEAKDRFDVSAKLGQMIKKAVDELEDGVGYTPVVVHLPAKTSQSYESVL